MSINRELEAENEVLREQNLMMNKSGMEKSARIRELTDAITDMVDCLTGEVLKADIKAAKSIAKQALKGEGR